MFCKQPASNYKKTVEYKFANNKKFANFTMNLLSLLKQQHLSFNSLTLGSHCSRTKQVQLRKARTWCKLIPVPVSLLCILDVHKMFFLTVVYLCLMLQNSSRTTRENLPVASVFDSCRFNCTSFMSLSSSSWRVIRARVSNAIIKYINVHMKRAGLHKNAYARASNNICI